MKYQPIHKYCAHCDDYFARDELHWYTSKDGEKTKLKCRRFANHTGFAKLIIPPDRLTPPHRNRHPKKGYTRLFCVTCNRLELVMRRKNEVYECLQCHTQRGGIRVKPKEGLFPEMIVRKWGYEAPDIGNRLDPEHNIGIKLINAIRAKALKGIAQRVRFDMTFNTVL